MKRHKLLWATILVLINSAWPIFGDLHAVATKQCGVHTCAPEQYCSNFLHQCDNCRNVCEESEHNFDQSVCESECQDYIHNKLYSKREDAFSLKHEEELKSIKALQILIGISFAIHIFVVVTVLFMCYRQAPSTWCKKGRKIFGYFSAKDKTANKTTKSKTQPDTLSSVESQPQATHSTPKKSNDLKIEMPTIATTPGTQSDVSPSEAGSPDTISTTLSSRRGLPSQDRVTDFAYDNPAMTNSTRTSQRSYNHDSSV